MKMEFTLQRFTAREKCSELQWVSAKHSALTTIVKYLCENKVDWSTILWAVQCYVHDYRIDTIDERCMYVICIDRKSVGIATKGNLPDINNSNMHIIMMRHNDTMICMMGSGYQCCRNYYAEKMTS